MTITGYYVTCDDSICSDCAADDAYSCTNPQCEAKWTVRDGWGEAICGDGDSGQHSVFEDWYNPQPITYDQKSDTPTHCYKCGEVIEHTLTREGAEYVLEAIRENCRNGYRNLAVVQWWNYYGDTDSDLIQWESSITLNIWRTLPLGVYRKDALHWYDGSENALKLTGDRDRVKILRGRGEGNTMLVDQFRKMVDAERKDAVNNA